MTKPKVEGGKLSPEEVENKTKEESEDKTSKNEQEEEDSQKSSQGENLEQESKQGSEQKSDEEKTSEKSEKDPEIQRRDAQISHYREKLDKAEGELNQYKKSGVPMPQDPMEVVKLAKSLEGYNEDEIEFITRNASEKSPSGIIDATKDEWVQSAIEKRREKVAQEQKTPDSSSPSSSSKEANWNEVASDDDKFFQKIEEEKKKEDRGL